MMRNIEDKRIAVYNEECYNSLKFLSNSFNIKLFVPEKLDYPYEPINPFGSQSYWIMFVKMNLDLKIPSWKINKTPQLEVYEKLLTSHEFKEIPPDVTCCEFYSHFAEEIEHRHYFNDDYRNQIVRFSKDSIGSTPIKTERVIIDELNQYAYRTETRKEYVERCRRKYNTDFIYKIYLWNSYHDVEFEYRELPSKFQLENNPNLPPIRSWKEIVQVEDQSNLSPLRDLVIELCNRLEGNNILNYTICLDYTLQNIHITEVQHNLTSFHNYTDPRGLCY